MIYTVLLIPVLYVLLNLYVGKRINQAFYLKEDRRRVHRKLIWFVPFIGPLMIRSHWSKKNRPLEVITKNKRKSELGADFYESHTAVTGD